MKSVRQISGRTAYRIRTIIRSAVAVAAGMLLIIGVQYATRHFSSIVTPPSDDPPALQRSENSAITSPFSVQKNSEITSSHALPADIQKLIDARQFVRAKNALLQAASDAVAAEQDALLAKLLSHLGEVSLVQRDIDTAEVYLAEALDVFNQTGDEVSAAGVYMQMGRLHLVTRERARQASEAYDTLLVARWKISNGQFRTAEDELRRAAENSLSLNRYGAAASTYETLYKGYESEGDFYQAQLAGIEVVKLHASSGRTADAESMLQEMRELGLSEDEYSGLKTSIRVLNKEFEQSVLAIGAARDQAQLYNQLVARGDVVNAWRFRQQASAAMAKASTRAQYRRQPDVLVELYKSNLSMEKAKESLQKAQEVYFRHGIDTQLVQNLQEKIY